MLYWKVSPTGSVSSAVLSLRTAFSSASSLVSPFPWYDLPVFVEMPLVWFRRWRTVISADAFSSATRNHGR